MGRRGIPSSRASRVCGHLGAFPQSHEPLSSTAGAVAGRRTAGGGAAPLLLAAAGRRRPAPVGAAAPQGGPPRLPPRRRLPFDCEGPLNRVVAEVNGGVAELLRLEGEVLARRAHHHLESHHHPRSRETRSRTQGGDGDEGGRGTLGLPRAAAQRPVLLAHAPPRASAPASPDRTCRPPAARSSARLPKRGGRPCACRGAADALRISGRFSGDPSEAPI